MWVDFMTMKFEAPINLGDYSVHVPGCADTPESREKLYRDQLVEWASILAQIPSMDRGRIYEIFGKAKYKANLVYRGCDCDTECDCRPPKGRLVHYWTSGIRPHADIRVLRRRAQAEHLRRIPHLQVPYRFSGVDLRRPMSSITYYMD